MFYTVYVCTKYTLKPFTLFLDFSDEEYASSLYFVSSDIEMKKCPVCPYSTPLPGNLKRHIILHKGERPYECNICGKKYTLKQHLKRHYVVHSLSSG